MEGEKIERGKDQQAVLTEAVAVIREGGVVAFPTETYYGLAVDPFNEQALANLFQLKRRQADKPILTLVENLRQLSLLTSSVPEIFKPLMAKFWPGALTLIFPALEYMSGVLTGNSGTVGVRISSHPLAARLVSMAGMPLTATSANLSGQAPANSAAQVREQFGVKLDLIIDRGSTPGRGGSTIIGCENNSISLIRDGIIPYTEIVEALSSSPLLAKKEGGI